MVRVEGREGGQPSYDIAVGSRPVQLLSTEQTSSIQSLCCPECKEDFGSKSVLDKHKNKCDVYNNILEYFTDIPFKLSDRIVQNLKDMDVEEEEEVNMSMILTNNLTLKKKSTNYAIIQNEKNFLSTRNVFSVSFATPHFAGRIG